MLRKNKRCTWVGLMGGLLAVICGCGTDFTGFTVANGGTFAKAPGPVTATEPPGGSTLFPIISQPPGVHPNPRPNPKQPVTPVPVIVVR